MQDYLGIDNFLLLPESQHDEIVGVVQGLQSCAWRVVEAQAAGRSHGCSGRTFLPSMTASHVKM